MTTIVLESTGLYRQIVTEITALQQKNADFWADADIKSSFDRYYDLSSGYSEQQMSELHPGLAGKVKAIEASVIKFSGDRAQLGERACQSKINALQEIGSHFGRKAAAAIQGGQCFYLAVIDAYAQAQDYRLNQLDGITISFNDALGIGGSSLLNGLSKALKLKEAELSQIMQSSVFAGILFDGESQEKRLVEALRLQGIACKKMVFDGYEDNLPLIRVRFTALQGNSIVNLAKEIGVHCQEFIYENPFGKKTKDMPVSLPAMHPEELIGLKSCLLWDLADNRCPQDNHTITLRSRLAEINTLLSEDVIGLR